MNYAPNDARMTLGWTTFAVALAVTTRVSYSLTRTLVEEVGRETLNRQAGR